MDDIAGLRDFAWVLDVSIGHRGDVHQSVLVDPHINKGAERSDVRHDTFENHAGLEILELFHSLTEVRRFEGRARITTGLLKFPQDVGDGRHPKHGIGEGLWFEPARLYSRLRNETTRSLLQWRRYRGPRARLISGCSP
jgi:hypothetical protein